MTLCWDKMDSGTLGHCPHAFGNVTDGITSSKGGTPSMLVVNIVVFV
jgi:hypothetical protein